MNKKQDRNTRYYIDIDLKSLKIVNKDFDDKRNIKVHLEDSNLHRVFLTKGQYHKLNDKL